MFENDREEAARELEEYCCMRRSVNEIYNNRDSIENWDRELVKSVSASFNEMVSGPILRIAVIIFVVMLVFPFAIKLLLPSTIVTFSSPGNTVAFFLVCALFLVKYALRYQKTAKTAFKYKLKRYKRSGTADKLLADFKQSVSKYDDAFRLGNNFIFGRGCGEFYQLDKIKRIARARINYFSDGQLTYSEYCITVKYERADGTLCYLQSEQFGNSEMWSEFTREIRERCSTVMITSYIYEREVRHTSFHD